MRRSCSSDFAANAASMLAVFALMVAVASADTAGDRPARHALGKVDPRSRPSNAAGALAMVRRPPALVPGRQDRNKPRVLVGGRPLCEHPGDWRGPNSGEARAGRFDLINALKSGL
jgi:hypothetical protein